MRSEWLVAWGLACLSLACTAAGPRDDALLQPSQDLDDGLRIERVRISTQDVFSDEEAAGRPFYRLINALHRTSREILIRREMWFEEGAIVSDDQARELERELRNTGLFSEVRVTLDEATQAVDGERSGELLVETEDRLSLAVGGSGFFIGGVGGVDAKIGESNLGGVGNEIEIEYRTNTESEERLQLYFDDRHFIDEWHRASVALGDSEEGFDVTLGIARPLRHLADTNNWGASARYGEDAVDFFESGESIAEVPRDAWRGSAFTQRFWGPRDRRYSFGGELTFEQSEFGAATGVGAATIDVPGDVDELRSTLFGRIRHIDGFRKLRRVDALGPVEDLELSRSWSASFGAVLRDESGIDETLAPVAGLGARGAFDVNDDMFFTYQADGSLRWNAGDALGWFASAALHGYVRLSDAHLIATSATYDAVFEGQGLPAQLTLGEDNGLRGFPAREFAGDRRVRINVEDRIDTGAEFRSVHLGLAPFVDAGWISDDGLGDPLISAGIGLRIGSEELLGNGVFRIDLAFPLAQPDGADFSPTVSIALGQVFELFGNNESLPGR